MPKDINLLPTELRSREDKLRKKKSASGPVLHMPEKQDAKAPAPLGKGHVTLLSRLRASLAPKKGKKEKEEKPQKVKEKEVQPFLEKLAASTAPAPTKPVIEPPKKEKPVPQEPRPHFARLPEPAPQQHGAPNSHGKKQRPHEIRVPAAKPPIPVPSLPRDLARPPQGPVPVVKKRGTKLHMPEERSSSTFGINLLRTAGSKKKKGTPHPGLRWLALAAFVILLAIIYSSSLYLVRQKELSALASLKDVATDIEEREGHWNAMQEDLSHSAARATRIYAARTLLDERKLWTRTFEFLEEHTVSGVNYSSLRVDGRGTGAFLELEAKDYELFVYQLLVFDDLPKIVESYEFGDIVLVNEKDPQETRVRVGIALTFSEEFLTQSR